MEQTNKQTKIKVRGFHLDLYGHVNNARYLEFLEEGRWNLFEDQITTIGAMGISFFVVNINISYRAPAVLNADLSIHSAITEIKTRSCVIRQTVTDSNTGKLIADADVTFVIVGQSGKAMTINDDIRELLGKYTDAE